MFEALGRLTTGVYDSYFDSVAELIFKPGIREHSIFVAGDRDDVERIVVAFGLRNEGGLQARAAAWGAYADLTPLEAAGKLIVTPSDTPDAEVNAWHRDLVDLTTEDRRFLVDSLLRGGRERWRLPDVKQLVQKAVLEGRFDRSDLSAAVLAQLATLDGS